MAEVGWVVPWKVPRGSYLGHRHSALEGAVGCGLEGEREGIVEELEGGLKIIQYLSWLRHHG